MQKILFGIEFFVIFRYYIGGGEIMKDTSMYRNLSYQIILMLADAVLLYASLWLALFLRYGENFTSIMFLEHARIFTAIYILWIVIFYANNLYNLFKIKQSLNFYLDLFRSLFIGGIIAVIIFYLLPYHDLTPKRLLVMNGVLFSILAIIWRPFFIKLVSDQLPVNKLAIIGINNRTLELGRQLLDKSHLGYQLVAISGDGKQNISAPALAKNDVKVFSQPNELINLIKTREIDTIVFANGLIGNQLMHNFFKYLHMSIKFYNLPEFYEELNYKIPVTELNHAWFLNNINESDKKVFDSIKRFVDAVFSLVLFIILLPIVAICALLIIIETPGDCIYTQTRVGKNNHKFKVYKLRTMVQNAEANGPQWSQKNDPRVTKVGSFLRRSRIDEIPQLINIMRGEMSFVGPRPERPELIEPLINEVPFYQTRHLIKPGLTGWAQVNFPYGSSIKDALEKLQYDLYYIKHRSMSLDLTIMLRTIIIILKLKGR